MRGFIRTFLVIFGTLALAVVAIAGFRGDYTQRTPIEIFPDMDRQPKYKSQTLKIKPPATKLTSKIS